MISRTRRCCSRPRGATGLERGEGFGIGALEWFTALLHNGRGSHGEALEAARRACEHDDVVVFSSALAELVEAAVREGRRDEAAAALRCLSARTQASGTSWALGVEALSRALVHDDEGAYRESVERLAGTRGAVHLARSQLLYGEWLRREDRRADALEQLRTAFDSFSRIGAAGFAERARLELQRRRRDRPPRRRHAARRADLPGGAGRAAGA